MKWLKGGLYSLSVSQSCVADGQISNSGMRLLYLSPYSPDFNPIEEAFSCIKSWIRLHRDEVLVEMDGDDISRPYEILWEAVFTSVTIDKVQGWFRDCGYL